MAVGHQGTVTTACTLREMLEEKVAFETAFERRQVCRTVLDRPIRQFIPNIDTEQENLHTLKCCCIIVHTVPVRFE